MSHDLLALVSFLSQQKKVPFSPITVDNVQRPRILLTIA